MGKLHFEVVRIFPEIGGSDQAAVVFLDSQPNADDMKDRL
jgi:hypothetical protein